MNTKENITRLLKDAINSPSGGNSQPWAFKITGNKLDILAYPEKDNPVLNFRFRGTMIAIGALIENIVISAPNYGLEPTVEIAENEDNPVIASITFNDFKLPPDPLFPYIRTRTTNRKKYKNETITKEIIDNIVNQGNSVSGSMASTSFIDDREKMIIVGEAASKNEIVMLENKVLHKLFFKEVTWDSDEEKTRGGSGLYIKTLELEKPQEIIFSIIRHWPMMAVLKKIGLAKFIASENAKIYSTGGAMGIISVTGAGHENFIAAGRVLERIWLSCAKEGISLQLLTGILFMRQKIAAGETEIFSPQHLNLINASYSQISSAFGVKNDIIALAFRTGYSESPSAFSYKKEPIILS